MLLTIMVLTIFVSYNIIGIVTAFSFGHFLWSRYITAVVVGVIMIILITMGLLHNTYTKLKWCESYEENIELLEAKNSIECISYIIEYNSKVESLQENSKDPIMKTLFSNWIERINMLEKYDISDTGYYIPTIDEWDSIKQTIKA